MPVLDFESEISSIKDYVDEGKTTVRMIQLSTKNAPGFDFKAGQFVMIYVDGIKSPNDPSKPKLSSMSICNAPSQKGFVELCLRVHDKPGPSVSRFIAEQGKTGMKVGVKGPFGVFGMKENPKNVAFVGTGTGIAPLMSMFRHLLSQKFLGKIVFFYGCRNNNDFLYKEELLRAAGENKNVDLQVIFSREEFRGKTGHVQELLKAYNFSDKKSFQFYLCGNPRAVQEEKDALFGLGFLPEQVHDEKW